MYSLRLADLALAGVTLLIVRVLVNGVRLAP